ncbi:unnamed protein product, partial [Didymodactylos carnosus]
TDFDDDPLETLKRYKPRSLDELEKRTKFTKKEIQLIYQGFKQDFLICLSTLCRGSIEDRLRWVFTLYDTKKSGRITREDLHQIVCAVYSLLGTCSNPRYGDETTREHTANVFKKFDVGQGFITIQEFMNACLNDNTIIQSIDSLRSTV